MTKASEWAARVEAWQSSGQSASEYCANREYTAKSLQWWASRLRRNKLKAPSQGGSAPVRLAQVVSASAFSDARKASTGVVVVHFGAARVEVPPGIDLGTLVTVMEVLGFGGVGSAR